MAFELLESLGTFSVFSCKERPASELAQARSGLNAIFSTRSILHAGAEWIVRLYCSFQDRDHQYLVSHLDMFSQGCGGRFNITSFSILSLGVYQMLEYMGGGDLLNLLKERDVPEENSMLLEVIYHCQVYLA